MNNILRTLGIIKTDYNTQEQLNGLAYLSQLKQQRKAREEALSQGWY